MTIIVESTETPPDPVFEGRRRWAAAALVTVGAALQVAEFAFEPAGQDTSKAGVACWLAHPDRIQRS